MRIAIGAGHSPNCRGAVGNGYDEHDEAVRCVNIFIKLCKAHGVSVYNCFDDSSNVYENLYEQVEHANAQDVDVAIQWHFNSFSKSTATGTEVEYHAGSAKGKAYAQKAQNAMCDVLGLSSRGLKADNLYWTRETDAPSILIETCFISNANDMKVYVSKREELVEAVFTAITGISAVEKKTTVKGLLGVHLALPANTNRNKWKRENGHFVNMATHTLLDVAGDCVKDGAPVRVAPKRDDLDVSGITQTWDIEQYGTSGFDTYVELSPRNHSSTSLTRTSNKVGAGVTVEKSTNELNQKWTAVWAGATNVYRLFGVGTYYVLTADKE